MKKQNKLETLVFGQVVTGKDLDELAPRIFVGTQPTFFYCVIRTEAYLLQKLKGKTERYKVITKYSLGEE